MASGLQSSETTETSEAGPSQDIFNEENFATVLQDEDKTRIVPQKIENDQLKQNYEYSDENQLQDSELRRKLYFIHSELELYFILLQSIQLNYWRYLADIANFSPF